MRKIKIANHIASNFALVKDGQVVINAKFLQVPNLSSYLSALLWHP
ncbi:15474_t:CDS:2 [Gigaspora rosea]|nr:15474_t:CDS:2 [Gigaspora rosea]